MQQSGFHMSSNGVDQQGLGKAAAIYWNLRPSEIYELALARGEGDRGICEYPSMNLGPGNRGWSSSYTNIRYSTVQYDHALLAPSC